MLRIHNRIDVNGDPNSHIHTHTYTSRTLKRERVNGIINNMHGNIQTAFICSCGCHVATGIARTRIAAKLEV